MGPGVRGERTALRPVRPSDFGMLCRWFSDPGMFEHWGGAPLSGDEVNRQFLAGRDDDVAPMIVEADGAAAGYIQAWSSGDRAGGIDIVLLPEARGRGLGPDAVGALARWLCGNQGWRRVTVDPLAGNRSAIRAFEKAGFRYDGDLVPKPEGLVWLLVYEPAKT